MANASPVRSKPKDQGGQPHRRRRPSNKSCRFCADKVTLIDHKRVEAIRQYVTDRGKIVPRRISGNCAKHQRALTTAIKRARALALLPYTAD